MNHFLVVLLMAACGVVLPNGNPTLSASHPYHVSYAEVEWNPETGHFEVALCVWPADLEKAISRMSGRAIDLDAEPGVEAMFEQYVARRFRLIGDSGKVRPIRWVGAQVGLKQAWLYFEVAGDKKPGRWTIENRVFFELNEDQLNQIQIRMGPVRKSLSSTVESKPLSLETVRWKPAR
ncbi:MAG: hypothetical protein MK108_08740 [Mariniblastus sp.]|nr:hypothetical protein [Mariniblastus sp.]